ncbi:TcaA 3rd/4th domain-containing protein [Lysinibacillus xylanilyticus]|uniref:TcaA 3rd/4th domain-containing protein n=1 Tax=Lysinibacillus xylanilyticus TaxID=582475 RepID=UPI0037F7D7BE
MEFCTNCGEQNSEEVSFCTNCGKILQHAQLKTSEKNEPQLSTHNHQEITPRKKMTNKQKWIYSISGIVLLVITIVHFTLSSIYDPAKQINTMNKAYNNQDKEAFFQEFHVKKGTEANAKNFYATVKDYGWTNLRNQLTYEIERLKKNENPDIIYNNGEFISVNSKPILFGLYNKVEFVIIPTEVYINAPFKNMTIKFGDKKVVSKSEGEKVNLGKYIPGEYTWSYSYEDGYMPLADKGDVILKAQSENIAEIDIDWNFQTISVDSDLEDAIVYVNGKSTGKKVSELRELYPVQLNNKIEIYAQSQGKDGKTVKSEILPLDNDSIYLAFEHIRTEQKMAEHEEVIRNIYKEFRSDYASAISYTNFDYIERYFKEGSKIKKDYAKFVTDHNHIPGYNYDFLLNDITAFKTLSEKQFELQSFETFNYSSENEGSINYERKKKYVFSYENGKYFIDEIVDLDTKKTKL